MATGNNGVLDGLRRIGGKFRDVAVDGGLPGAPLGYRLRGATQSGPPKTGTWKAGDQVPDRTGTVWTCTLGGTGQAAAWQGSLTGLAPTGDATGAADYKNIQGLLNLAGRAILQTGLFFVSQTLQISSSTCLSGAGKGVTTIRMASGSWSGQAQVGGVNGLAAIMTAGNTTASSIAIRDLTVDGNLTGITALPGWATSGTAAGDNVTNSPLHLNNVTSLLIENVEVINPIGYTVYLQSCAQFSIVNCRVISGQTSATQGWGLPSQQDGIHLDGCSFGRIENPYIDTGTSTTNVGDDGIALQSLSGACNDITIAGGSIRSAEAGVDLALSGYNIYNIAVTGVDFWTTENNGVTVQPFTVSSAIAYNVAVSGCTFNSIASISGNASAVLGLYDYTRVSSTGASWAGVSFTGNDVYGGSNASMLGVYAQQGTGLTVGNNNFYDFPGAIAIQIGDDNKPVTQFTVTGNEMYCTASGATAILIADSSYGTVSGNAGSGNFGFGSNGCQIIGTSIAPAGVTVNGNQFSNFGGGIVETNNGQQPDYNTITGNNLHGTYSGSANAAVIITGPHTVGQQPLLDVGGIEDTEQFVCLASSYTLTSATTTQKLFNATSNGALTVPGGATFFFECFFSLSGMSATSGNCLFDVLGAGTATLTSAAWTAVGMDATTPGTAAAAGGSFTAAHASAGNIVTAATGTAMVAQIKGVIRTNAAGTIIPSVGLTTAAAAVVGANSWFRIWPVGSSTVASVGDWS
jgi:hypothetical protein